jgi:hypothetical protein
MSNLQNGAFLAGDGLDGNTLSRADDLTRSQGRAGIIPRFHKVAVPKGDGGFFDEERVELLVPGDAKSSPVLVVTEKVKRDFPVQYKAWKDGEEVAQTGTPLELLVGQSSLLFTLKAKHIHTVEQMAAVSDSQLEGIGLGARELRERAKLILERQGAARDAAKEQAQEQTIADLQAQLAELKALVKKPEGDGPAPVDSERPPEGAAPVSGDRPNRRGGKNE